MSSPLGPSSITRRLPLLLLAISALQLALWAGLLRLGWPWPILLAPLPLAHGPLMVGGFLGTVIGLERAVALELRYYAGVACDW